MRRNRCACFYRLGRAKRSGGAVDKDGGQGRGGRTSPSVFIKDEAVWASCSEREMEEFAMSI